MKLKECGQILRTIREEHGLTLRELSEEIGLAPATMRKLESGVYKMPRTRILRLADSTSPNAAMKLINAYQGVE
jgi:transcriptional regulator with XRE-family HTH domain